MHIYVNWFFAFSGSGKAVGITNFVIFINWVPQVESDAMTYAIIVDTDQTAYPRSLIRIYHVRLQNFKSR